MSSHSKPYQSHHKSRPALTYDKSFWTSATVIVHFRDWPSGAEISGSCSFMSTVRETWTIGWFLELVQQQRSFPALYPYHGLKLPGVVRQIATQVYNEANEPLEQACISIPVEDWHIPRYIPLWSRYSSVLVADQARNTRSSAPQVQVRKRPEVFVYLQMGDEDELLLSKELCSEPAIEAKDGKITGRSERWEDLAVCPIPTDEAVQIGTNDGTGS